MRFDVYISFKIKQKGREPVMEKDVKEGFPTFMEAAKYAADFTDKSLVEVLIIKRP